MPRFAMAVSSVLRSILSDLRSEVDLPGYMMPNDERESDRLDMHHHLATLLLRGKLHVAPIAENPQRVLDVGTGTGICSLKPSTIPRP